jgi:hypothetical protein
MNATCVHRKLFSFKSYGNYSPLNEVLKKQDSPPPSFSTFLNNRSPNTVCMHHEKYVNVNHAVHTDCSARALSLSLAV